jgi:hypothetical protein
VATSAIETIGTASHLIFLIQVCEIPHDSLSVVLEFFALHFDLGHLGGPLLRELRLFPIESLISYTLLSFILYIEIIATFWTICILLLASHEVSFHFADLFKEILLFESQSLSFRGKFLKIVSTSFLEVLQTSRITARIRALYSSSYFFFFNLST